MRWLIPLVVLPLLAGCSEQQMCISRATKDLRQVQSFIHEAEGNLSRGYALMEKDFVTYSTEICGTDGDDKPIYCRVPVVETRTVPKAIDLEAEAAKLASLKKKEIQLQAQAETATQACIAQYPE